MRETDFHDVNETVIAEVLHVNINNNDNAHGKALIFRCIAQTMFSPTI